MAWRLCRVIGSVQILVVHVRLSHSLCLSATRLAYATNMADTKDIRTEDLNHTEKVLPDQHRRVSSVADLNRHKNLDAK